MLAAVLAVAVEAPPPGVALSELTIRLIGPFGPVSLVVPSCSAALFARCSSTGSPVDPVDAERRPRRACERRRDGAQKNVARGTRDLAAVHQCRICRRCRHRQARQYIVDGEDDRVGDVVRPVDVRLECVVQSLLSPVSKLCCRPCAIGNEPSGALAALCAARVAGLSEAGPERAGGIDWPSSSASGGSPTPRASAMASLTSSLQP